MTDTTVQMNELLSILIETLDIPRSYYEKAKERGQSLEDWLQRDGSLVAAFSPDVYPQGSFRYGTVIRPLLDDDFYDLDLVCLISASKVQMSQQEVKDLVGHEIRAYAEAKRFNDPAEEKPRCWRLNYADDVSFHMDILPAVPEDASTIEMLVQRGVPRHWAELAIAITDYRHPQYWQIDSRWFSSNPRGIGRWFEQYARAVADDRIRELVANRAYASMEEVPPYEWKTPLQRTIQILKRHRDVMFRDDRDLAPISMIITTLAAQSYEGERDIYSAVVNVLERMPNHVRHTRPRVPNPVNPAEDFADRWSTNPSLEENFWRWHSQAKADLAFLERSLGADRLGREVKSRFDVQLSTDHIKRLERLGSSVPRISVVSPVISIPSAPKPWGGNG